MQKTKWDGAQEPTISLISTIYYRRTITFRNIVNEKESQCNIIRIFVNKIKQVNKNKMEQKFEKQKIKTKWGIRKTNLDHINCMVYILDQEQKEKLYIPFINW